MQNSIPVEKPILCSQTSNMQIQPNPPWIPLMLLLLLIFLLLLVFRVLYTSLVLLILPVCSVPMESSGRYQLLELDVGVNIILLASPNVALIESDASHCLIDISLVQTAHLTVLRVRILKWYLQMDPYSYIYVFF